MPKHKNDEVSTEWIIEWAPFTLLDDKNESLLLKTSEDLQKNFLSKQEGFIKRELLKSSNNRWVDLVYWKNKETAEKAMKNAASSSICSQYFSLMVEADHNNPSEGVSIFAIAEIYH